MMKNSTIAVLFCLLAQGFVFAEENFFTASVPADIKTKTLSLETDPSYFWSSKYYIKDGETSLSNIYAKQKGDISVKCPVMQQKNAGSQRYLAIELPLSSAEKIPELILNPAKKKVPGVLKLFVSIEKSNDDLIYSPHRFVFRDTPTYSKDVSKYKSTTDIEAFLTDMSGKNNYLTVAQKDVLPEFRRMSLSVQASDGKNEKLKNPDIVCSSKDLELSKSINNKTVGLYSNVFYNDATIPTSDSKPMKVEAITFHWMLSPSDAAIMESIIQNAKNLTELNTKLAESKFSNTHEYQEFNKLTKSN